MGGAILAIFVVTAHWITLLGSPDVDTWEENSNKLPNRETWWQLKERPCHKVLVVLLLKASKNQQRSLVKLSQFGTP